MSKKIFTTFLLFFLTGLIFFTYFSFSESTDFWAQCSDNCGALPTCPQNPTEPCCLTPSTQGTCDHSITFKGSGGYTQTYCCCAKPQWYLQNPPSWTCPPGPTCSISSITESSNYAYTSGTTIWYNTASTGSFTVNVNTNPTTGISKVNFPNTVSNGGDDTTSPYSQQYNWITTSTYNGVSTVTVYDTSGQTGSCTFAVNKDTTAPSTTDSITGTWCVSQTTTLTCSDTGGSGCDKTYYCIDSSNSCTPTTQYTGTLTTSYTTNAYIRFYSTDKVSNQENVKSDILCFLTPAKSITLSANPTSVLADGSSTSTITASLSDSRSGVSISFSTSLGTLSSSSCTSDSTGKCSVTIKSSSVGTATITASASGYTSGSVQVSFTIPPTIPSISVSANPTSVYADGLSTSTITAQTSNGASTTISFSTNLGVFTDTGTSSTSCTGSSCSKYIKSSSVGTATITASASGYTSGTTQVSFIQCTRANPTVSISPIAQTGSPGDTLTYSVIVTDQDTSGCGSTPFSLSLTRCDLSCSINKDLLILSPGSSDSATISMTSSSTAFSGNYLFEITATNDYSTSYYGKSTGYYIIPYIPPITLTADPPSIPADGLNQSKLTAQIKDKIANKVITFSTTLGTLSNPSCTTGSGGNCSVNISSTQIGIGTVTASEPTYGQAQAQVSFVYPSLTLVSVYPTSAVPGQNVTITVYLKSDKINQLSDVKLRIMIKEVETEWNESMGCIFYGKNLTETGWKNTESCPGLTTTSEQGDNFSWTYNCTNSDKNKVSTGIYRGYSINVTTSSDNFINMSFVCKAPPIPGGTYTVIVYPEVSYPTAAKLPSGYYNVIMQSFEGTGSGDVTINNLPTGSTVVITDNNFKILAIGSSSTLTIPSAVTQGYLLVYTPDSLTWTFSGTNSYSQYYTLSLTDYTISTTSWTPPTGFNSLLVYGLPQLSLVQVKDSTSTIANGVKDLYSTYAVVSVSGLPVSGKLLVKTPMAWYNGDINGGDVYEYV